MDHISMLQNKICSSHHCRFFRAQSFFTVKSNVLCTRSKPINLSPVSVPPVRAKIIREWAHFAMGQAYNVSCQVRKLNSFEKHLLYITLKLIIIINISPLIIPSGARIQAPCPNLAICRHQSAEGGQLQGKIV